ncbi:hypothetical protein SEA_CRATER_85 [Gordonia phage Crater]|nr:hypothetical protein SEA_CRATER_85 [Gordonia phage Crater]
MSDILVRRSRNRTRENRRPGGLYNWNVYDFTGPKVFIRQFTYRYYEAALNAALALSRREPIKTHGLFAVQRIEHDSLQDPRRDEVKP